MLEGNVAVDPQVEIFETGAKEAVAAYVAVSAAGTDAACHAGPVAMCEAAVLNHADVSFDPDAGVQTRQRCALSSGFDVGNMIRALSVVLSRLLLAPVVTENTPPLCRMRIGAIVQPFTTVFTRCCRRGSSRCSMCRRSQRRCAGRRSWGHIPPRVRRRGRPMSYWPAVKGAPK